MKKILAIFTVLFAVMSLNAKENTIKFLVSEGGDKSFPLECGIDSNATWGLDTALGEVSMFPGHPPEGFDVALQFNDTFENGTIDIIWSNKDLKPKSDSVIFSRLYYFNCQRDSDNAKLIINRLNDGSKPYIDSVVVLDYPIDPFFSKNLSASENYEIPKGFDKFYVKIYYNFSSTAVEENNDATLIYPNPANDYIKTHNLKSVSIYNEIGDLVYSNSGLNEQETLNISSLKAGAYLLKLIDNDGKACSGKLIKCN